MQMIGIDVGGDGEGKPHVHAARICPHRPVDVIAELRERHDRIETLVHLTCGETEDCRIEADVLAAGEAQRCVHAGEGVGRQGDALLDGDARFVLPVDVVGGGSNEA